MSIHIDRVHNIPATTPSPANPHSCPQHLHNPRVVDNSPSPERSHPPDDRQTQMQQALKRSVTLVIWYRSNCDPLRLTHEISTFPLFQLSHYPSLVSDLDLTPASYVDAYNSATGHWEQHMISTVRAIESEQRLLYKLRRSLLVGLADDECTGLPEELALQVKNVHASPSRPHPPPSPTQLKRPLSDSAELPSAKRFYFSDGYPSHVYIPPPMSYILPTQTIPYTPPLASPPPPTRNGTPVDSSFHDSNINVPSPVIPATPLYTPNTATRMSFPQHPHPPLKRWPNDYTVSEIAAGFRAMDAMVAQSPTATQKAAFERVFGCRYVKSTVCRHRGVYRKADASVRSMFEAMGNHERAVWGEFVRRVEGRAATGKAGGSEEVGETPRGTGESLQSAGAGQERRSQSSSDRMAPATTGE